MSLEYYYRLPDGELGTVTDLNDDRVRLYTLDVTANAEEGSIGVSEVTLDDPEGDLTIPGHRVFGTLETALGSNGFVHVGYTGERKVNRGPYRIGPGRQWKVQLTDINTVLDRRLMVGSDAKRPAETDVQRVLWLEATNEGDLIDDTRYLSTGSPVDMDAADYRGQSFKDVLDDCAQQSGKNYFLTYFPDTATSDDPWGAFGLWYDFSASSNYSSSIRLTNDLADVDSTTTFAVSVEDTELTRDPSRVYSGAYVAYDGGAAYVERVATYEAFARRDATSPAENVKTKTKARARGRRYLADISTEEDAIVTSFQVPAAYVNHLREGMRVQVKFTHLPGYSSGYSWLRVLKRNVVQDSELTYTIQVELVGSPSAGGASCSSQTASGSFYPLGGSGVIPNPSTTGNVIYWRPGISIPEVVTPGHIGSWHFPTYQGGGSGTTDTMGTCVQNRVRLIVDGEGTMTIQTSSPGGSVDLIARLFHANGVEDVIDETQTVTSGASIVFDVSTHGGVNCTHWVDVTDQGPCGTGWGFTSMAWVAA